MDPQQLIVGRRMGLDKLEPRSRGRMARQPPPQGGILGDRKPMAFRQRQRIPVGGKESHPRQRERSRWLAAAKPRAATAARAQVAGSGTATVQARP